MSWGWILVSLAIGEHYLLCLSSYSFPLLLIHMLIPSANVVLVFLLKKCYVPWEKCMLGIVIFWPSARGKCHSRWCTGRKRHIPMAVMWGNRVGGNWLMKWDELKKFPWYTHRLMHRKRVTSELHDSYFRLMTIKLSISKIEWASNDYIIQLSSTSQWSCQ